MEAVARAAQEMGTAEIEPGVSMSEALSNPAARAQAARWRSGSESRRVTAILARMLEALKNVRPAWTECQGAAALPVAQPLPVRQRISGASASWWDYVLYRMRHQVMTRLTMRTWCAVIFLLLFPKLLGMIVSACLKLVFRVGVAMLGRVVLERGREFHDMVQMAFSASTFFEAELLAWVDGLLFDSPPVPMPAPPNMVPNTSSSSTDLQGCCPAPAGPWNLITTMLLLLDMALHHRHRGRVG